MSEGAVGQKTSKPWFAPKQYGFGTGLPISWEGWLVFALYLIIVSAAPVVMPLLLPNPVVFLPSMVAAMIVATAVMLVICAKKTEGGWRWQGKPDQGN